MNYNPKMTLEFLFIYLFILKVGVFLRDIINMCKMPSKNSLSKFL